MTSFIPNKKFLKFQKSLQIDVCKWIQSCLPRDRWKEFLQVIPFQGDLPETLQRVNNFTAYPNGPIQVQTDCPITGRELSLVIFRDMSCAIARKDASGNGHEILPVMLSIASESYDKSLKGTPYHERGGTVPCIMMQARPKGLYWKTRNFEISAEEITTLLEEEVRNIAQTVLSAPPIVDPRVYRNLPKGARYASFSRWPNPKNPGQLPDELPAAIQLLSAGATSPGADGSSQVSIFRKLPVEPWSASKAPRTIRISGKDVDRNLRKKIRQLLSHPDLRIDDCLLMGPETETLIAVNVDGKDLTAHQKMAALSRIRHLAPGFNYPLED